MRSFAWRECCLGLHVVRASCRRRVPAALSQSMHLTGVESENELAQLLLQLFDIQAHAAEEFLHMYYSCEARFQRMLLLPKRSAGCAQGAAFARCRAAAAASRLPRHAGHAGGCSCGLRSSPGAGSSAAYRQDCGKSWTPLLLHGTAFKFPCTRSPALRFDVRYHAEMHFMVSAVCLQDRALERVLSLRGLHVRRACSARQRWRRWSAGSRRWPTCSRSWHWIPATSRCTE